MAGITGQAQQNLLNSIFGAIDTTSNVANDYITKEARLATTQKKLQLQMDVNDKLLEISRNGKWQDWNKEINDFFDQKKSEMSNPDSPYYCKNNLQGQMFDEALNDSLVNVSNRVAQMAVQRQGQQMQVDNEKAKENARNLGMSGLEYYNFANSLDDGEEALNLLTPEKKEEKRKDNFYIGYTDEQNKLFDQLSPAAVDAGKDFNDVWNTIKSNQSKMNGIAEGINTDDFDLKQKKTLEAKYESMITDMQNKNAEKLAAIVQAMDQQTTEEGIVKQALLGQSMMNNMQGRKLSESQRLRYSEYFKLAIGGGVKGSKSGSGSSSSNAKQFENLIKAAPDTAIQLLQDGKVSNAYEAIGVMSDTLTKEWFGNDYKENLNMSDAEKQDNYELLYKGRVSEQALTNQIIDKLVEKYPTAKYYLDGNLKKLLEDMNKNPKKYGGATPGELADFMMDTILSADKNMTDEQFTEKLNTYVNNCYVEKCKYVELDKKGNLEKKFNANKPADVAKAARLAMENDYVFTYNGQERWAANKKEALEAKGGIVDVLKNAVASTLDIPQSEIESGAVGMYYMPDKEHNDLTSTPVITYNNKSYVVIPDDNDKGFTVKEYKGDKDSLKNDEGIAGNTGNSKTARANNKADAQQTVKDAHANTAELTQQRIESVNKMINDTPSTTKAMQSAKKVKDAEWQGGDLSNRIVYLKDTVNAINDDAAKVEKGNMTKEQFRGKYNIDYTQWKDSKEETSRFSLILNS